LPEAVDRPPIVALSPVREAETLIRQRLQGTLPASRDEREGTLGLVDDLVIRAHGTEMVGQKERDLCPPTQVAQSNCEDLGLIQSRQDAPNVARWHER
jgi:hypothetical protein